MAAGHRAICPDLVESGPSDKPTQRDDHTYARHVERMRGAQGGEHPTIHGAGHFLQEDAGEELAGHMVRFLEQGAG